MFRLMQQRGMSYKEILDLPAPVYNDFMFFCAHIEPTGGYMNTFNTALIQQTIAAQYCKKVPKLHDLHPYFPRDISTSETAANDISNCIEIGPDGKGRFRRDLLKNNK
jgi:hypothetical protein